ncbi:transmembrane protein 161B isoform X2 [Cylas formicarius]|nr:transmembrane protein 161B isoform X2 [Cylas formicarius]
MLGALFTFPGLRIAKMHWDLLKYFRENRLKQILLNVSFALPFLLVVLWIKPVTKDYLTVRVFSGRGAPLMTEQSFEVARLVAIVFTMCLKIALMPWYLQAYLDMAYRRTEEQKKEAGRITNIEFQKKIAAVFYYLCVVTLQYIAPIIICLFLTLMYKTLSEYQWNWLYSGVSGLEILDQNNSASSKLNIDPFHLADNSGTISESVEVFHLKLESLKAIFTASIFKGLLGFATWWCCFLYFATTSVGLIYQSYFSIV